MCHVSGAMYRWLKTSDMRQRQRDREKYRRELGEGGQPTTQLKVLQTGVFLEVESKITPVTWSGLLGGPESLSGSLGVFLVSRGTIQVSVSFEISTE